MCNLYFGVEKLEDSIGASYARICSSRTLTTRAFLYSLHAAVAARLQKSIYFHIVSRIALQDWIALPLSA